MTTPWVSGARLIGSNDANNSADTSLVAANPDGSVLERLEDLKIGSRFWVKKTIVSNTITYQTPVDLTGVSSGELAIVDVIAKCDATGIGAGTNFELKTNNAKGLLNFFVTAVSGLAGAVKTVDLANASVTKIKTILESGKKVQMQNTVADGTGTGTVDIYICFERLTAGATIAAL